MSPNATSQRNTGKDKSAATPVELLNMNGDDKIDFAEFIHMIHHGTRLENRDLHREPVFTIAWEHVFC